MTDRFRLLCKELVDELHAYKIANPQHDDSLVTRARPELSQVDTTIKLYEKKEMIRKDIEDLKEYLRNLPPHLRNGSYSEVYEQRLTSLCSELADVHLPSDGGLRAIAAEIIRAVTDHVVPDEGDHWRRDMRGDEWNRWEQRKQTREALLAIAADLKAQPQGGVHVVGPRNQEDSKYSRGF